MFVWLGILLPDYYADKVRDICNQYNESIGLDNIAFSLPQHISLKITFQSDNYEIVIKEIEDYLSKKHRFSVVVSGVYKYSSIIWLEFTQNHTLSQLHSEIDTLLLTKFDIPQHQFDKEFKFHSTLFIDNNLNKLNEMYDLLVREQFETKLDLYKFVIAISPNGEGRTFKIIKEIECI